ncbi:ornithine carbamoyltransferase [Bartonella quintana JK 12]|uniref:Ornithine carbamoyltransferase n=2 Tax=Bartonella quintana TaxID=803 RepID=W3U1S0_BARQI|nr:ornithine carbamoyltransferase [Bartonella quintana BQ2-D70]ETS14979.1 ornithine carbamoyltransferase [Bartonella quintana JK 73rel]ETS16819.1 ornithine carbamoyltransferase [Bartonella quintana JK 73]ETS17066.1 ornithine carbamoyltransferase [Bartonella quintana JK 12]ETS19361.1 ornithine carbamoyltransferase [Bartonella quintana JK 7]KEC58596.1 ornithine carbamoyltransferase [Bartonella quintana JK 19]KEC61907.1 ornithine carbamoyltransferase [Bartonella quintana JK 31]KEC63250.1 ornith
MTNTWVSMGQEFRARSHSVFQPYQVNEALIKLAKLYALLMHCLPAHRDEEAIDTMIDGPQSVVLMRLKIVSIPKKQFLHSVYKMRFSLHINLSNKSYKRQRYE